MSAAHLSTALLNMSRAEHGDVQILRTARAVRPRPRARPGGLTGTDQLAR